MEDRRKTARIRLTNDIGVFDTQTKTRIGKLVDISTEGIMLASGNPMEINTVYEFRVPMPISIYGKNEIICNAVCLWCNKTNSPSGYQAGFQLVGKDPALKEMIAIWMKSPSI